MKQTREVYTINDFQLDLILSRIAERLDTLEGIRPSEGDSGLDLVVSSVTIYDENDTIIHQFN